MNVIEVRPTVRADNAALSNVLVAVHAKDGYPVEGVESVDHWLDLPDAIAQWTATVDGDPVGHVALSRPGPADVAPSLLLNDSGISREKVAVLGRFFVDPEARNLGVGQRLLEAAESLAEREGLCLLLEVMQKDQAAVRLYRRRAWNFLAEFEHAHGEGRLEPAMAFVLDKSVH